MYNKKKSFNLWFHQYAVCYSSIKKCIEYREQFFYILDFITPMGTTESAAENEAFEQDFLSHHDYQKVQYGW